MNAFPFSDARWIAPDESCPSPIISRVFQADRCEQAVSFAEYRKALEQPAQDRQRD